MCDCDSSFEKRSLAAFRNSKSQYVQPHRRSNQPQNNNQKRITASENKTIMPAYKDAVSSMDCDSRSISSLTTIVASNKVSPDMTDKIPYKDDERDVSTLTASKEPDDSMNPNSVFDGTPLEEQSLSSLSNDDGTLDPDLQAEVDAAREAAKAANEKARKEQRKRNLKRQGMGDVKKKPRNDDDDKNDGGPHDTIQAATAGYKTAGESS